MATTSALRGRSTGARLGRRAAFMLQSAILITFMAASSAPTPLYGVYQARWDFSPLTLTVVFGSYAVALLAALLTLGSLSDHIGRRPVLLGALLLEAAAMLSFGLADGVEALLVARILQGVATGAAMGVLGAGLLDLEHPGFPGRGTLVNSVTPMIGLALGALGSSVLVEWLPAPTEAVYVVLMVALLVQALGVVHSHETAQPLGGALASLRPRLALPRTARKAVLICAPSVVASWALGGLYLSLGPTVARTVLGSTSHLLGGFVVLSLTGSGAVAVLAARTATARTAMSVGTLALLCGVGVTLFGIQDGSAWAFFAGTMVAGVGFGAGFAGALRTVLPLAAPQERAGLLATFYVISYLAFSVPAVVAGVFVVHVGLLATARGYAIVVMALAATALVGLWVQRPSRSAPSSA